MTGWIFEAPGGVRDFRDPTHWHNAMAAEARGIVIDLVAIVLGKDASDVTVADIAKVGPTLAYVDPVEALPAGAGTTAAISPWPAFPRAVRRRGPWQDFPAVPGDPAGVNRAAEHLGDEDHRAGVFVDRHDAVIHLPVRDRQDEYLEWASERDSDGKLTKVTFVAEGYDYFSTLFAHDEGRCLDLYREFTGDTSIKVDDLRAPNGVYRRVANGSRYTVVEPGAFNPRNRHNINPGIVHLSHRANSLGAEVNLAGVSGIARKKADGSRLSGANSEELLCCCEGGNPNRNSDPLISQQAYRLVLQGKRYTLANPVGLYIAGAEHHRLLTKDGKELPPEWWTVIRGVGFHNAGESRVLRLVLAPPKGEKLTFSDLEVDGEPVRFAGQLADLLLVHLFVTLWERGEAAVGPEVDCSGTCCRKAASEELMLSKGTCGPGFDLAFPGLVKSSAPALMSHALSAVGAVPTPAKNVR